MKNRKGFTLVELLAVIVVLSIVLGLTAYIVVNAINSAKEKSYKITKTSVEKQASNYLLENADKLFFISEDDGSEYQCITVENLIEYGYLKNDILNSPIAKDKNVKLTHYIFLERDANTRAITKTLYTETDDNVECVAAVSAKGDISVFIPDINEWKTEREITLTYKVRDVIDIGELRKYEYNYSYTPKENGEKETQITNDLLVKKIKVTSEGTLESNIKKDGSVITSKETKIERIDRIGPVIALGNNKEETVRHEVVIPLVLTDEGIGPNYETFTTSDLVIKIGDTKIDSKSYELKHKSGKDYNLTITDDTHKGKVTIEIDEKKIEDKLKNPNIKTILPTNITFDNIYTVKYNANGGTGSMAPSKIEYGKEFTTSKNIFTKKGYTFNGWKETDGTAWTLTSPGVYESGKGSWTWKYTKDIDLNAQWKAATITINYNANGGSGAPSAQTYTYAETGTVNLSNTKPTRTGYNFLGWSESQSATTASYQPGYAWPKSNLGTNNSYTLYAVWKAKTITINYNANGGSGAPSAQTYTYAETGTVKLLNEKPTRTGYNFSGWSESQSATTASYQPGDAWLKSNLGTNNSYTLYAVWQAKTYTVNYSCGSGATGTPPSTFTVKYGDRYSIAANGGSCKKTGNNFVGWASPDGTDNWKGYSGTWTYENGTYGVSNNKLTLTAVWSPKPIRIFFNTNGGTVSGDGYSGSGSGNTGWVLTTLSQYKYTYDGKDYASQKCTYGNNCEVWKCRDASGWEFKKKNSSPKTGEEWLVQKGTSGSFTYDTKLKQMEPYTYQYMVDNFVQYERSDYYEVNLFVNWVTTTCTLKFSNTNFKYEVNGKKYNANTNINLTCGSSVTIKAIEQSCSNKFDWWLGSPIDKIKTNPKTFTINSNITIGVSDWYGCKCSGRFDSYQKCVNGCDGTCSNDDDLSGTGVTGGWVCSC